MKGEIANQARRAFSELKRPDRASPLSSSAETPALSRALRTAISISSSVAYSTTTAAWSGVIDLCLHFLVTLGRSLTNKLNICLGYDTISVAIGLQLLSRHDHGLVWWHSHAVMMFVSGFMGWYLAGLELRGWMAVMGGPAGVSEDAFVVTTP